jgi:hypothetical protein
MELTALAIMVGDACEISTVSNMILHKFLIRSPFFNCMKPVESDVSNIVLKLSAQVGKIGPSKQSQVVLWFLIIIEQSKHSLKKN